MFYCDPCRRKNFWPTAIITSFGKCEVCGVPALCHDRPSASLPAEPRPAPQFYESRHEVEANPFNEKYPPRKKVELPEPYMTTRIRAIGLEKEIRLYTEDQVIGLLQNLGLVVKPY